MRKPAMWTIPVLVFIWLPGCNYLATEPASEPAHTAGTITQAPSSLPARFGGTYAFLIEEYPERPTGPSASPYTTGDKYHVTVKEQTRIERRTATGNVRSVSPEDIAVGLKAEVWFDGPILESYPAQALASRILILDPAP